MTTLFETAQKMRDDPKNEMVYLMDFVQDFRRAPSLDLLSELAPLSKEKTALLAAVAETLCREARLPVPQWALETAPLKEPYFVSGIESLKAILLVESPAPFRRRNIFVLKNFLHRV